MTKRSSLLPSASMRSQTASAMGSMSRVVAVFAIQSERKADAIMKPRTRRWREVPTLLTIARAMRLWTPQRSSPIATMNAPMNSSTNWFM